MTFTKERLTELSRRENVGAILGEEIAELARIALASLEAEPVCVIDQANLDYLKSGSDADVWPASRIEMGDVLLYRAAMLQGAEPVSNRDELPDGWVACSERLPEDEQEVITHNIFGYRHVSFFDEHSGNFFDRLDGSPVDCVEHVLVSHWMPMPAAPQQEVK
ncbi:DUF551 domain-containing protein [Enterobacter hormaechei]